MGRMRKLSAEQRRAAKVALYEDLDAGRLWVEIRCGRRMIARAKQLAPGFG